VGPTVRSANAVAGVTRSPCRGYPTPVRVAAESRQRHHRRDRRGHDPLAHPRAPGLLGRVRPRDQVLCREDEGNGVTASGNRSWPPYSARPRERGPHRHLPRRPLPLNRLAPRHKGGPWSRVITWHLLADPEVRFADLGAGFYDNLNLVERWFSALTTKKLQCSRTAEPRPLADDITAWVEHWNENRNRSPGTKPPKRFLTAAAPPSTNKRRFNPTGH